MGYWIQSISIYLNLFFLFKLQKDMGELEDPRKKTSGTTHARVISDLQTVTYDASINVLFYLTLFLFFFKN